MGRRSKDEDDGISLFPFLSVLACVIGLFTLLITAFAVVQIDTEGVAQAEDLEHISAELVAVDAELVTLEDRSAAAGQQLQELQKAQWELNAVTAKLDQLRAMQPTAEAPIDLAARRAELETLEAEFARLQEQVTALEQQVAEMPAPPQGAVVEIRPGGSGIDIEPTFIECRSDSVVLLEVDPPKRIARPEIATHPDFLAALDHVAAHEKRSVIFLVRSDGIELYYTASDVARGRFARNGKLPVIGQGKIDLRQFRRERS